MWPCWSEKTRLIDSGRSVGVFRPPSDSTGIVSETLREWKLRESDAHQGVSNREQI